MMEGLRIDQPIVGSRGFKAQVTQKKFETIRKALSLSGNEGEDEYDFHCMWISSDGRWKVGVGKFGKEYYLDRIKWKDGHVGNNPNDMRPMIYCDGVEIQFDSSFDHVFRFFQEVGAESHETLELLGSLFFRNAFLLDHDENLDYRPSGEIVSAIEAVVPEYDGIPIEVYLQYLEMIAWNEDVKYDTLGYDVTKGIGRQNNMLTYAHLISIILGKGSLSKLCSSFTRPPVGVSPITINLAAETFPMLDIRR